MISSVTPNVLNSGNLVYFGTSVPASTDLITFNAGDVVINTAPSAGGPIGWLCVTGGLPGTWEAMAPGTVEAVYNMNANASLATQPFFLNGTQVFKVVAAYESHEVAGSDL